MANTQVINKPSRMLTFLNENNDKRVVEWVIDTVNDNTVLTNWDNIVDLGEENVEKVITTVDSDLVSQKEYNITASSSGETVSLNVSNGIMSNGAVCEMVGSNAYVPIESATAFNQNDLSIYKNGVLLRKGTDVEYTSTNVITFLKSVETTDWIAIVKIIGA